MTGGQGPAHSRSRSGVQQRDENPVPWTRDASIVDHVTWAFLAAGVLSLFPTICARFARDLQGHENASEGTAVDRSPTAGPTETRPRVRTNASRSGSR